MSKKQSTTGLLPPDKKKKVDTPGKGSIGAFGSKGTVKRKGSSDALMSKPFGGKDSKIAEPKHSSFVKFTRKRTDLPLSLNN